MTDNDKYVITEGQLKRLVKNGVSIISEQVATLVLTHPLSEHDADIALQAYQEGYAVGRTDQQLEDDDNRKPFRIKHDAEIAKKERERMDKFIEWCRSFDDYTCGTMFTPSFVLKKLDTLRCEQL